MPSKARPLHSDQISAMAVTGEDERQTGLKAATWCIRNGVTETGLLEILQMMGLADSAKPVNARRAWR